jgi:ribosomal protein S18 acetylase RimI-like enzyme
VLSVHDVGHRVVVRRFAGERDGRPVFSDVLGELVAWGDIVVVRTAAGSEVEVPRAHVAAGKRIPPKPVSRYPREAAQSQPSERPKGVTGMAGEPHTTIDPLELEHINARGWQGLRTEWLGRWLLRSAGGFTGRANSALPLGDPGMPLAEALAFVESWYGEQGIVPMIQVPLPVCEQLRDDAVAAGWSPQWGADVMTASCAGVLAAIPENSELPVVTFDDEPDAAWLSMYHYRGGTLPQNAIDVLRTGDVRAFASVRQDGEPVAIARAVVVGDWMGLSAVEVAPGARRRGIASHVLRAAVGYGAERGARSVYLQVEEGNEAAQALYGKAGLQTHHSYRYLRAPDRSTS